MYVLIQISGKRITLYAKATSAASTIVIVKSDAPV